MLKKKLNTKSAPKNFMRIKNPINNTMKNHHDLPSHNRNFLISVTALFFLTALMLFICYMFYLYFCLLSASPSPRI